MLIRTLVTFSLLAAGTSGCIQGEPDTGSITQNSLSYSKPSNYVFCGTAAYNHNISHEFMTDGTDDTWVSANSTCTYPGGACGQTECGSGLTQQQLDTANCLPVVVNNQTIYGYCIYRP